MKKLLALLLALVMVLSLAGCVTNLRPDSTIPEKPGENETTESTAAKMKFTVTVVYADGTSKDFSYETNEEFVGPVLEEAGLIKGNAGPYGMEITHVDGVKAVYAEDKAYWAVYEGEEYAMQGIDTTPVKDGGVYKLVYTNA
jgi:hypothetical protein